VQKVRIEKGSKPPALASEFTPDSEVITEYAVKGHAPKTVSEKYNKIAAPSNPKAIFDAEKNVVTLTWDYNNPGNANVQFEITVTDGVAPKTSTVTERVVTLQNPTPGTTYSITITAIMDNKRSDPATTSVEIPLPQQNEVDEGTGIGDGNDNGNGDGNGEGDGDGDGEEDEPVTTDPGNGKTPVKKASSPFGLDAFLRYFS
jgi:penicillin-binding protein 1A